ncbi:MAG: hypothetical protein ACI93P_001358, partial [bacterium]
MLKAYSLIKRFTTLDCSPVIYTIYTPVAKAA